MCVGPCRIVSAKRRWVLRVAEEEEEEEEAGDEEQPRNETRGGK